MAVQRSFRPLILYDFLIHVSTCLSKASHTDLSLESAVMIQGGLFCIHWLNPLHISPILSLLKPPHMLLPSRTDSVVGDRSERTHFTFTMYREVDMQRIWCFQRADGVEFSTGNHCGHPPVCESLYAQFASRPGIRCYIDPSPTYPTDSYHSFPFSPFFFGLHPCGHDSIFVI